MLPLRWAEFGQRSRVIWRVKNGSSQSKVCISRVYSWDPPPSIVGTDAALLLILWCVSCNKSKVGSPTILGSTWCGNPLKILSVDLVIVMNLGRTISQNYYNNFVLPKLGALLLMVLACAHLPVLVDVIGRYVSPV